MWFGSDGRTWSLLAGPAAGKPLRQPGAPVEGIRRRGERAGAFTMPSTRTTAAPHEPPPAPASPARGKGQPPMPALISPTSSALISPTVVTSPFWIRQSRNGPVMSPYWSNDTGPITPS
jgi:hypothetical protein